MSTEIELVPFALSAGSGVMVCCVDDAQAIIAQRDARIAELAREIDANCMREAREIGILKRECDRLRNELAAMRAPSRMVLPERGNENEGNSYSVMQAMARNQALDEVARLNPCRAQADDWVCGNCGSNVQTRLDDAQQKESE